MINRFTLGLVSPMVLSGMVGTRPADAAPATQPVVSHAQKLVVTRSAGEFTVKISLVDVTPEGTVTTHTSVVTLKEGTRVEQVSGVSKSGNPSDVWTGTRVEVISARGRDTLSVLTTVVDNGTITWAEASNVGTGDGEQ